jgi:hypothetical protein
MSRNGKVRFTLDRRRRLLVSWAGFHHTAFVIDLVSRRIVGPAGVEFAACRVHRQRAREGELEPAGERCRKPSTSAIVLSNAWRSGTPSARRSKSRNVGRLRGRRPHEAKGGSLTQSVRKQVPSQQDQREDDRYRDNA